MILYNWKNYIKRRSFIFNLYVVITQDGPWEAGLRFTQVLFINSSLPGQNGHHFADNIFRFIYLNKTFCILIKILLKFVPKDPTDNKWVLVQVMAWCLIGDKPLPKPMLIQFTDAYVQH